VAHPLAVAAAETLTGNRTLTNAEIREAQIWSFDPGGSARDLTLPTVAAANAGLVLYIANKADAAEVLTIKDGVGTICTPTQNESAIVWCDGATWDGIATASS
jgi:hypothetical protein